MVLELDNDPLLKRIPLVEGWKVLAPVVLYAKIGQGGMGSVYRGRHLDLDIDVAVKCLKPSLAAEDEQFVARFRREAKLAAGLTHENLVRVYDYRRAHGLHYLVMEFVDGETARDRVKRKGRLNEREAATILLGAARGLAKAHRNQETIVHRDVKPDNILISRRGEVKLADLGIAKALEQGDKATLHTTGVIGTPQYMAPEQWERDVELGPQADVWSFGATLYFLLTGENAIRGGNERQVYVDVCQRAFPDVLLRRPDLSSALAAILAKCVRRDMRERYADAGELAGALTEFVGKNSASLIDSDTGAERIAPLVSPPPMPTLRRIRTKVENKRGANPPPQSSGTAILPRQGPRARPWLMGGAIAAMVLACSGAWIWLEGSQSERDSSALEAPVNTAGAAAAPMTIEVLEPKPDADGVVYVGKESLALSIRVANPAATALSASLNGKSLVCKAREGGFEVTGRLLPDVPSSVELSCGETTRTLQVLFDSKDPVVTIESPAPGAPPINRKSAAIVARVAEANLAGVRLGDTPMSQAQDGTWRAEGVSLAKEGENSFKILATDRAGRTGFASLRIARDTRAPELSRKSKPKAGSTVEAGVALELELIFDEAIAAVVVQGREIRGTGREARLSVDVPPGSGAWTLEGTARDPAGNSAPFALSLERKATASMASSSVGFEGFEIVGKERNALGYPRVIRHAATEIELLAVDYRNDARPSFYVSSKLVTKRQFSEKGPRNEAQVGVSADQVDAWCLGRGRPLALPTLADWQRMSKSANPTISSPSTAVGELLQGSDSDSDWPIHTPRGGEATQSRAESSTTLGFRVVFRAP